VRDAALQWDWTEHRVNGGSQGLGAVEDDQNALLAVKAAVDQVGQQHPGDGRVLGRAVPQAQRDLDSVGGDPERDDAAAALELDAVEHQRCEADAAGVGERPRGRGPRSRGPTLRP